MKKIRDFKTVGTSGKQYVVTEFKPVIDVSDLDNPHATRLGMSSFHLADGGRVNRMSDTDYEIVITGERIKKV